LPSASRRPSSRRLRSSPRAPTWTGNFPGSVARSVKRLVKCRSTTWPPSLSPAVSFAPMFFSPRRHVAFIRHMVARLWARVDAHVHTPANQLVPPVQEGGLANHAGVFFPLPPSSLFVTYADEVCLSVWSVAFHVLRPGYCSHDLAVHC